MINIKRTIRQKKNDFLYNHITSVKWLLRGNLFYTYLKRKFKDPKTKADYAYLSDEVTSLVRNEFRDEVYPFFGTLLSIYRDGYFRWADDFDFAFTDKNTLSLKTIEKVRELGGQFYKFSYIEGIGVVELSFIYKGVNIDFFRLFHEKGGIKHYCTDFRTSIPRRQSNEEITIDFYRKIFSVEYPNFKVSLDTMKNAYIPSRVEDIMQNHYGKDWRVPKESSYIDYKSYKFSTAAAITLKSKNYNLLVEKLTYLLER